MQTCFPEEIKQIKKEYLQGETTQRLWVFTELDKYFYAMKKLALDFGSISSFTQLQHMSVKQTCMGGEPEFVIFPIFLITNDQYSGQICLFMPTLHFRKLLIFFGIV